MGRNPSTEVHRLQSLAQQEGPALPEDSLTMERMDRTLVTTGASWCLVADGAMFLAIGRIN